jgi:hypothetical protein
MKNCYGLKKQDYLKNGSSSANEYFPDRTRHWIYHPLPPNLAVP